MGKKRLIPAHGEEGFCNQGWTAENKRVDPSAGGGHFPESYKQDKEKDTRCKNQVFFFFLPG